MTSRKMIIGAAFAFVAATTAEAAEVRANLVLGSSVQCFQSRHGWFTDWQGPCSKFVQPDAIAVGKTFQADGNVIPINVIVVMRDDDSGVTSCAAASELGQIPSSGPTTDRIWLFIARCLPMVYDR